jgi:hypothetical protein
MTLVVLLHQHFLFRPSPFFNFASIITNCKYATMSKLNISYMKHFIHPIWSCFIASNFSSVPIVFHHFFTWIAVGDADLHCSLMLLRKASAVED